MDTYRTQTGTLYLRFKGFTIMCMQIVWGRMEEPQALIIYYVIKNLRKW